MPSFIYKYKNTYCGWTYIQTSVTNKGIRLVTSPAGCTIPDDEIPNLVSALQNYMSRRAKEITKGARTADESWVWE